MGYAIAILGLALYVALQTIILIKAADASYTVALASPEVIVR